MSIRAKCHFLICRAFKVLSIAGFTAVIRVSFEMINVTGLDEAAAVIADAMEQQQHLGVQAMATRATLGRDADYGEVINVSAFSGIIDYQPDELILTLRAGTPMCSVLPSGGTGGPSSPCILHISSVCGV